MVKILFISMLMLLISSCGDQTTETTAIPSEALTRIDSAIGKYAFVITSIRNSGLSDEEYRKLTNEADFALRDCASFVKAKGIDLAPIGVPDIDELVADLQSMTKFFAARFFEAFNLKLFGDYSIVELEDSSFSKNSNGTFDLSDREVPFFIFSSLVKKYPNLAGEFYEWHDGQMIPISRHAIIRAANYDLKNKSLSEFLGEMKLSLKPNGVDYDGNYWSVFTSGFKAAYLEEMDAKISKLNTDIKKLM